MKNYVVLLLCGGALVLAGCNDSVKSRETAKVTTRWKWSANSVVAVDKGIVIEQTGDTVEARFVHLKEDVSDFVVEQHISRGHYFANKRQLVFPPADMTPDQFKMALEMDIGRVEVSFTPEADVLKGKWVGQSTPNFDMDFIRVRH